MSVPLSFALIETRPLLWRRFLNRFINRMFPPVVQLILGILEPL